MQRDKLPGTIVLWPGVAEEQLATKAYYVRAGVFKDVDVVLYNHVGTNLSTGWGDSAGNGLVSVEYTFQGESGAQRQRARGAASSALDAVELMNVGWNYRREHLRIQQRSHYVVTNGGDQPNVVPRNASVWYYFRETSYPEIKRMWEIGDKMAEGAALMTDTTVTSRVLGSAWPIHTNKALAEAHHANITAVGLPQWTEADVDAGEGGAARAEGARGRHGDGDPAAPRPRGDSRRGKARRRLGRHRRHLVERADGHPELPGKLPGGARSQLGERDLDGDADRAQGRDRRREGAGDDGARRADAARDRHPGVGLLPQRSDEERHLHAADSPAGQAGHLAQRRRRWRSTVRK